MTPATATQRELLAAIIDEPDDDTPRLVFADCIEEGGDEEWAELIRAQIELRTCSNANRRFFLVMREQQLFHDLRARLMPACPPRPHGCGGIGKRLLRAAGARGHVGDCPLCSGSGVCPGELVRGFPVCRVPLEAIGDELVDPCKRCNRRRDWHDALTGDGKCFDCGGLGTVRVWRLHPHAAEARRERGVTWVPSDREPMPQMIDGVCTGYLWTGMRMSGYRCDLPQSLLTKEVRKVHPTAAAAQAALVAACNAG